MTTYTDSLKLKTLVIRWFKNDKIILEKTNYLESSNDLIKSYEYQNNRIIRITTYFGILDSDFMIDKKTLMNIESYSYKNERLTNINTQRVYPDKNTEINTTKFEYNEFGLLSKELLIKDDSILIEKYYSYRYFK